MARKAWRNDKPSRPWEMANAHSEGEAMRSHEMSLHPKSRNGLVGTIHKVRAKGAEEGFGKHLEKEGKNQNEK